MLIICKIKIYYMLMWMFLFRNNVDFAHCSLQMHHENS